MFPQRMIVVYFPSFSYDLRFDEPIIHAGPVSFHDTNAIRATRRLRLPRSLFQRYKMKSFGLHLQQRMIQKRK